MRQLVALSAEHRVLTPEFVFAQVDRRAPLQEILIARRQVVFKLGDARFSKGQGVDARFRPRAPCTRLRAFPDSLSVLRAPTRDPSTRDRAR